MGLPEAKLSLEALVHPREGCAVASTDEVRNAAPKTKVLNRERVRFEVAGGNYHPVAAFDFQRRIAFVKFVGSAATRPSRRARFWAVGPVCAAAAGVRGERPVAKPDSTVVKIGL